MVQIGKSDLNVFPLNLGGNVFGWTADRDASFAILDAFVAGGGNFIDTADGYSAWGPGNKGGESETIIGEWLADRSPQNVIVATKVSTHPDFRGQSAANVRAGAEASLRRLGVETIDLYYAHFDDAETPLEETVPAYAKLVEDGLVRYVAVSNYTDARIREWLAIADQIGGGHPVAIQPHYNLLERANVEATIRPVAEEFGLSVIPYYSLASGFLTGKYRDQAAIEQGLSPRAGGVTKYANAKGFAIIRALDEVANTHGFSVASVALAWLRSQPTVAAPIASASRVDQVADLLASATLELTADELAELTRVSEPES